MTTASISRLTPAKIVKRRNSGEYWRLLDVREPWEMEIAKVPGSVAMPMVEIRGRVGGLKHEEPVAILCHTGARSMVVAAWLVQQGCETVANIEGGIDDWSVEVDAAIARY